VVVWIHRKTNLLQIGSVFTASRDNLTTDQINLFEGVRGESTYRTTQPQLIQKVNLFQNDSEVNPMKDEPTTDRFSLLPPRDITLLQIRLISSEEFEVSLLQNDSTSVDLEDKPTTERFDLN
jgi:hypothetical protein